MTDFSTGDKCPESGYWLKAQANQLIWINKGEIFPSHYELKNIDQHGREVFEPISDVINFQYIGNRKIETQEKLNHIDRNLMWSDLSDKEREQAFFLYRSHGKYITEILRTASDTIWNWYFYLNSGGLIGSITLLSFKPDDIFFVSMCSILTILFLLGVVSIIYAVHLEKIRFMKHGNMQDQLITNLQRENIGIKDFYDGLDSKTEIPENKIARFEKLSLYFFISGPIVGIIFFAIKNWSVIKNIFNFLICSIR